MKTREMCGGCHATGMDGYAMIISAGVSVNAYATALTHAQAISEHRSLLTMHDSLRNRTHASAKAEPVFLEPAGMHC